MARVPRYFVYILASRSGVLYVGSSSDLTRRMYQHVHGLIPGFTKSYRVDRLVWWDATPNAGAAVEREREIKAWRREKKVELIEATNPGWIDLAADWFSDSRGQDPSLRSG
jgi:putative endonuclease